MKEIIGTYSDFSKLLASFRNTQMLFRGQANALHSIIPGIGRPHPDYVSNTRLEKALFREFKKQSADLVKDLPVNTDWEWLILAQHHGLKTRLLDWTSDWRIALYFATLPHDEMNRVPFSVFILPNPNIMAFDDLPESVFKLADDYFFQPPTVHPRINGQRAFVSAHSNPFAPLDHPRLIQFSFLPWAPFRRQIALFLTNSEITSSRLMPDLDGICKTLIDQPRIATGVTLDRPKTIVEGEWKAIPSSAIGRKAGEILPYIMTLCTLEVVLDWVPVEAMVGIPCYLDRELFGYLKYGNRGRTSFVLLSPDGTSQMTLHSTDETFSRLKISQKHIKKLIPNEPIVIRKTGHKRKRP